MFRWTLLVVAVCSANMLACQRATQPSAGDDNRILALALTHKYSDGGYTVVSPETGLGVTLRDPQDIAKAKSYIVKGLVVPGVDMAKLVDAFAARNAKSVRLTLKSAPQDGYLVDYEGAYRKYFEEGGGFWDQWYKDHPTAHGSMTVSLPMWDKASGIVLLYVGQQVGPLAGSGFVIAFRYDGTTLKEVKRVMLWIS